MLGFFAHASNVALTFCCPVKLAYTLCAKNVCVLPYCCPNPLKRYEERRKLVKKVTQHHS
jgi:hypothetical protein